MRRAFRGAALALAVFATASVAGAQDVIANPIDFGISAGLSAPMGDIADGYESGFHVQGSLQFKPAMLPLGFRADAMWNSIAGKVDGMSNLNMLAATGNAVFNFPMAAAPIKPYIIGGLGVYSYKVGFDDFGSERQTKFGVNAGIGTTFALSGFNTFAEVRFHNAFADEGSLRFVPISFGIMF